MATWVRYSQGVLALGSLLMAAVLSIWWLFRPDLVQVMPLALKLPFIGLGIWALGAAFLRPLAQDMAWFRLVYLVNHPLSHAVMGGFLILSLVITLMA